MTAPNLGAVTTPFLSPTERALIISAVGEPALQAIDRFDKADNDVNQAWAAADRRFAHAVDRGDIVRRYLRKGESAPTVMVPVLERLASAEAEWDAARLALAQLVVAHEAAICEFNAAVTETKR